MKKTTKIITIIGIVIAMLIVLTILWVIILKGNPSIIINYHKNQYKLVYQEGNTHTYKIYKTKNNRVWVESKIQPICTNDPCPSITNNYEIKFSEKHMETIIEFIDSFFQNQPYKEKKLSNSEISEDKLDILYSIIYNDEDYLNKKVYLLKDDKYDELNTNDRQLLFTISSIYIKCPTPTLYIYNDNTYEYFYTYAIDDNKVTPKTGNYDYDVNLILDNISQYETTDSAMYRLIDRNEQSHDISNFKQLETFFKKLNLEMNKCTELQQ